MSKRAIGKIGEDGKAYFTYGIGLKFRFIQKKGDKEYLLEVKSCFLSVESETEYYFCTKDGDDISEPLSSSRLGYLLNNQCKIIYAEGKREELPPLKDEVAVYYRDVIKPRRVEQSRAEHVLKSAGYYELEREYKNLSLDLILHRATAGADEELTELKTRMAKILARCGISEELLNEELDCSMCGNFGIVSAYNGKRAYTKLCNCAQARANEIKAYSAKLRLNPTK